ncbi:MAG TPA: prephenate dehydratase [Syntrophomonadaceae bacterium]|nr:prephenate dehydratase [Syntrophomonadaceae bacterium]
MDHKRIAYLGPTGSYSEIAAQNVASRMAAELLSCDDIETVFKMVEEGSALKGIVPIENSCEGSVYQVLDLLLQKKLYITGECILPIEHALLVKAGGNAAMITQIVSHPQALGQCRKYLKQNFPGLPQQTAASTAKAALQVALSSDPIAAIASPLTAAKYGLDILASNINDQSNNQTRFLILSACMPPLIKPAKSTLLLRIQDRPGALYDILGIFARRNINLTRIESRPTRRQLGQYYFFIDIEGHVLDTRIQEALHEAAKHTLMLRILGSYPPA